MSIGVHSEIGRLRRVLVHRPGREIDWMVPSLMERLLFDDILYGEEARSEHDVLRGVLEAAGATTLDPQTLLGDLFESDAALATTTIDGLRGPGRAGAAQEVGDELAEYLESLDPRKLAEALVAGVRAEDTGAGERVGDFYRLAPLPNYFFQRDPQVVLGNARLVPNMATDARRREPYLSDLVFQHHPDLAGVSERIQLEGHGRRQPTVEGGDLLVASPEVLMVGVSERTNRYAIDLLAKRLIRDGASGEGPGFRHLVVVEIPAKRSYMHLDTVFTFVDHGTCLAYLPVIAPGGAEEGDVYSIDLGAREVAYSLCDDLPSALGRVGVEVEEIVPCGGEMLIDQQREQWTDGANAFAIAPGVICLYRRNRRTTESLSQLGWRILSGEDVLAGRETVLDGGRTVVLLPDHELSRARGGPRCMTMPLERDPLAPKSA